MTRDVMKLPGIAGFKSDKSRVVCCFGPAVNPGGMLESLDVITIGLVDARPAYQLDQRLRYRYVYDPNQLIVSPATQALDSTAASAGMSCIVVAQ